MIFNFLSYTGLFTGLCAGGLGLFYQYALMLHFDWSYSALLTLATAGSYSWLQSPRPPFVADPVRLDWYKRHEQALKWWWGTCAVASVIFCVMLNWVQLVFIGHLGMVLFAYHWKLRKIRYLKSIVISYCWSMATCYLPVSIANANLFYFIECWIFIWCLSVAFDLRDEEYDQQMGLKTLVHLWGQQKTKAILAMVMMANLSFFALMLWPPGGWMVPFQWVTFLILLGRIDSRSADYLLIIGVDSLMLMRALTLIPLAFPE